MAEESSWYALYTRSRHEKIVSQSLTGENIESFVPVFKTLRQWSDRKKWVEAVLIPSYCFVRCPESVLHHAVSRSSVVRVVRFSGKPATIPATQIDYLRRISTSNLDIDVVSGDFAPGQKAIVSSGALAGLEGEIISYSGKEKVLFRIDHINHKILVSIPATFLSV